MAEKIFDQNFSGYWREINISGLSKKPGVYGVYRCLYNEKERTVTLKSLIYIGKADNLNQRISNHEKWKEWRQTLLKEEQICFCYTEVYNGDNERVEAALINNNKPPLNVEYMESFPFDKTTVNCSGDHKFIKSSNVVNRH